MSVKVSVWKAGAANRLSSLGDGEVRRAVKSFFRSKVKIWDLKGFEASVEV